MATPFVSIAAARWRWSLLVGVACLLIGVPARAAPPPPHIDHIFPAGGQRGQTVHVTVTGSDIRAATAARLTGAGVTTRIEKPKAPATAKSKKPRKARKPETVRIVVAIAPDAPLGQRDLRLITPGGASNRFRFVVGQLPEASEQEPNSEKAQAQALDSLPVVVNGQILAGDRDFFRFQAEAGQTLVCDLHARRLVPYIADAVPGWMQASLTLYDANGRVRMYVDDFRFHPDPLLIFKVEQTGAYVLEVKDVLYRGRGDFLYRLRIGALPYITHVFPLGVQRKHTSQVDLYGANLSAQHLPIAVPADGDVPPPVGLTCNGISSNTRPLASGDLEEIREAEPNDAIGEANPIDIPVTINGRIQRVGDTDCFILAAKAKQRLVIEVHARRLGSPLDSAIEVLNAKGRPLAQNDDTVDPAEGLLTHHADSRVAYTFPSAGKYVVRIRDVQGAGGDAYAYRLAVAPPRPDFVLRVIPDNPRVGPGESTAITVKALRRDGYTGEIRLAVRDLPDGFVTTGAVIPAKQDAVRLTVTAPPDAPVELLTPTIVGTGKIGNATVVREAVPAEERMQAFGFTHDVPTDELLLAVLKPGPFTVAVERTAEPVLRVHPGSEVTIVVKAVRREGAKGPIKLTAEKPPKGITIKPAVIADGEEQATVTIRVGKGVPVGFAQNIILTATLRAGKDSVTSTAPAIPIEIVAAPKNE